MEKKEKAVVHVDVALNFDAHVPQQGRKRRRSVHENEAEHSDHITLKKQRTQHTPLGQTQTPQKSTHLSSHPDPDLSDT